MRRLPRQNASAECRAQKELIDSTIRFYTGVQRAQLQLSSIHFRVSISISISSSTSYAFPVFAASQIPSPSWFSFAMVRGWVWAPKALVPFLSLSVHPKLCTLRTMTIRSWLCLQLDLLVLLIASSVGSMGMGIHLDLPLLYGIISSSVHHRKNDHLR